MHTMNDQSFNSINSQSAKYTVNSTYYPMKFDDQPQVFMYTMYVLCMHPIRLQPNPLNPFLTKVTH